MNRKLLILNLALAVAVIFAGVRIRDAYRAAKAREAAALNKRVSPAPAPPFTGLPEPKPVLPAGYADIAQKMLFDRSRNSIVEVPPPPPPPPPKPVPPLPAYHGQMTLPGEGVMVILSDAGGPHQGVHIGEMIGEFKLVEANRKEVGFEWDGQIIRKSVDELLSYTAANTQSAPAAVERTAQPAAPPVLKAIGPGTDTGNVAGDKYCDPNDSYPDGQVVDGYRKNIRRTPGGMSCYWEPVKR